MIAFVKKPIKELCTVRREHIVPRANVRYTLYSLPAFDNSHKPEMVDGKDIKSSKLVVEPDTILFNKLNVKFRRVWNIHEMNEENAICSTEFVPLKTNQNILQDYLYYNLISDALTNTMDAARKGTSCSQQRIDIDALFGYEISVPPVAVQEKIVNILLGIDKKIKQNEAINHNLQQQIQSLYDSWFKRFEPFTNSMQDSELGLIPSDWQVKDIYCIASIIYGAPFSSKFFNTERHGKPIVRIRDLKAQDVNTYTTECPPKGYLLQNGDIVVGMDGEFRPYIWGSDQAWLNQRVCVFVNKRPHGKAFLLYSIKPLLNIVEQTEVATTVIHIGKQDFDAFRIVVPPDNILNAFDEITAPMYDQIVNNICENRRLGILRDALLPKLMSGEIDVSEVEI